jgi:hypothetical protein
VSISAPIVAVGAQGQVMTRPTRVCDLFDLPDQVRKGDFV